MACFVFAESMFFMHKLCCIRIVKRACTGMHETRSVKTHCFSGRRIVFPEDTLCFEGGPQELYRWIDFKKGGAPPILYNGLPFGSLLKWGWPPHFI